MSLSVFDFPLNINEQLTAHNKFYKHCEYYPVPEELQPHFGCNWTLLAIYHCEDDIVIKNILTSFAQLAVCIPHIYLIEQSLDGQL